MLGFESLEAKSSLTSLLSFVDGGPATELRAEADAGRIHRFLAYVSLVDHIKIETSSPTVDQAQAADHWLEVESPR